MRLQAQLGGAPAVGLHRRHPRRARVRRLGGLATTSAGTSYRRRCCATARPDPAWCSCGWSPRRRAEGSPDPVDVVPEGPLPPGYLHVLDATGRPRRAGRSWCTRTRRRCAGWRSSTSSPTTPTARAGTCCRCPDGHRYGVDHGVCFHIEDKLRTVLWGWAGQRLSPAETRRGGVRCSTGCDGDLREQLEDLLTVREVDAVARRCERLLRTGRFPVPSGGWPSIPWPPF